MPDPPASAETSTDWAARCEAHASTLRDDILTDRGAHGMAQDLDAIADELRHLRVQLDTAIACNKTFSDRRKRVEELEAIVSKCGACNTELDPDETVDGKRLCHECFGRWHDAPVFARQVDAATKRMVCAEAIVEKLREATREAAEAASKGEENA